jgi:hypothetical protein
MACAGSRKSFSVEKILSNTCADALSDEPSGVLSDRDDGDNADNESYSNFEPKIVWKIKKTLHKLSSDIESECAENHNDSKGDICAAGEQVIISKLKIWGGGDSGV